MNSIDKWFENISGQDSTLDTIIKQSKDVASQATDLFASLIDFCSKNSTLCSVLGIIAFGWLLLFIQSKKKSQNMTWRDIGIAILSFILAPFGALLEKWLQPAPATEKTVKSIEDGVESLKTDTKKITEKMEELNIDARDVAKHLDKVPYNQDQKATEQKIQELYVAREIDANMKELLLVVTDKIFREKEALNKEIKELKEAGNTYLAEILEQITSALEKKSPDDLVEVHKKYIAKKKEEEIYVLQTLISTSTSMFAYEEAKYFYSKLIALDPSAENHFNFAYFLQKFNFLEDATREYEIALGLCRKLAKDNSQTYEPYVAKILNNFGAIYRQQNNFTPALEVYEEALRLYRKFAKDNPQTYEPDVAMILNNFGILHSAQGDFAQAQAEYEEALEIRKRLAAANPQAYEPDVATTLHNLANLHSVKYEFTQALPEYDEALEIRRRLAYANPQAYDPNVAMTLNNLAILHKNQGDFAQALEKYEEALGLYRKLAKDNPQAYEPNVAMTLNNLANLHQNQGDFAQALEEYEIALGLYRKLAAANPQAYEPYVAGTLNNLAISYAEQNNVALALQPYTEALELYRKLAKTNPKAYEINYAKILGMGVDLLGQDKGNLKIAKEILTKYPDVYRAQSLLEIIAELEAR